MADFDVVVVGGGIGGSGLAAVMQRAGHSCLVLERTMEFPDRTKGEWLAPWGQLDAAAAGVLGDFAKARGHVLSRHIGYDETLDPAEAEANAINLGLVPGTNGPMTQRHPDACQVLFDAAVDAGAETVRGVRDVRVVPGRSPSVEYAVGSATRSVTARIVVGADGRNSVVRRQVGIDLRRDRPHHFFSGLLVDGAEDWPPDTEAMGTEGDRNFLVFPQGEGRVRLYLGFALDQRDRLSGPGGPAEFLRSFRLDCVPRSDALASARPISPCATYANEDAWTEVPFVDGVVLVGDAAGWNDPITGQGLSITMRDIRMLSEILLASDDWTCSELRPFAEERTERMRKLRWSAALVAALSSEFGPDARERRLRARSRTADDPSLLSYFMILLFGPDAVPSEYFCRETWDRILN